MKLRIKKLHFNAVVPTYATEGAACFDLVAATVDGASTIGCGVWDNRPLVCDTGLAFEVPPGYAMMIYSRSGHGFKHDTRLANCVGVIDSDYRGSVQVKLTCDRQDDDGAPLPLFVRPGDRIAQAMIVPVPDVTFELVAEQLSITERGAGGMGSTGA
jgi:dUTP pyrophosphatase